jgi:hypothetical protein
LQTVQNRLEELSAKLGANVQHAEKEIRKQITALEERAQTTKASVETANAEMKKWAAESVSTVSEWKAKHDVSRLVARAERAEHYAKACAQVAVASVEAAEQAALDAKLARMDADAAKSAKIA